jgi:hypothetical protein
LTLTTAAHAALTFTGERFTPENRGAIWYEHWHRYCLARRSCAASACSTRPAAKATAARSSRSAATVDRRRRRRGAIAHARARYARRPVLRAGIGRRRCRCRRERRPRRVVRDDRAPAPQREMLAEFRRVLAPAASS